MDPDGIEVWVLKKKTSQYSLSSIIPRTEWVLTYALNPEDFLLPVSDTKSVKLGEFFCQQPPPPGFPQRPFMSGFHPQDSRIVYLRLDIVIFSYNLETKLLDVVHYHGTSYPSCFYDLFPYVQPLWPPYLPHLPFQSCPIQFGSSVQPPAEPAGIPFVALI
ncbi:unnamed protein product [Ilex paraguariensis]|uniref:F-box protein n=1 Tax=Ilex paraguariensis TaxID=185542 RepID=A0ABC8U2I4_9AQUA